MEIHPVAVVVYSGTKKVEEVSGVIKQFLPGKKLKVSLLFHGHDLTLEYDEKKDVYVSRIGTVGFEVTIEAPATIKRTEGISVAEIKRDKFLKLDDDASD